jgi:multidrug efflux pump subunit AcrA (membrane-fusion protein)
VQQQEVQLRYFSVTAPTAGIVGDVPVRVGNQVSTQTMLTTIDQNETLELNVQRADRARRGAAQGLPLQVLGNEGTTIVARRRRLHLAARRRSDAVGAREGAGPQPGRQLRARSTSRARIIWKTPKGWSCR